MSKSELNWIKPMLSTGEYADVHFLVGNGDAKEIIPAHKFILKLASDVFEAMFRFDSQNQNAENASTNCPLIEVPDVEAAAFKVMLSFIYAGDLSELNGDNAMEVLYAAKKYNIPALVSPSLKIPISKLRNVFLAYAQACLFDLEDFTNCCLSYIDKNADTLLKSEAFLQTEQKLLCQILEPENRRQMLGPALFTIRFPLFSQKEFWETIVPSGVLTVDEVIGVEQYHNDANGINEGIPYTLRFPTHRRFWAFGTITMDIEKVSEFAREEVESSRKSETVYINGIPWKIWAQIKKKKESTDNNEKWLGIYLLCTASEKDLNWRCFVRSATFRIVSQKNGTENSTGILIDRVFDNKSPNSRAFVNFISFADLMNSSNGFYNREEDKITLVIDVKVKDEKMEKFLYDSDKSNGTISMEIEKVSEFAREIIGSERKSESVHIKGFSWKIMAQIEKKDHSIDNEKWLDIFLLCAAPKQENWNCKSSAIIRIVSQKSGVTDLSRELNDDVFDNKTNAWGYNFISFAELMDPEKGFYDQNEDKVTLAIDVNVKELLPAHKLILKLASAVFDAMFGFDAKNEKAEFDSANCPVKVPNVEAAAFKVMLRFIYTEELSELNGDNSMAVLYAEFLQIDENLLCEILERDELQIREEISIWKAALHWADAKCLQNGIENSAENRRDRDKRRSITPLTFVV
ncbi:hypothetical protein niasHS_015516 [Heterodera schachtii]|uniref:BTB domain-containing protein n=1 Tax=Heterodera schachtii TaxID=97005 RepID=A0ABD2IDK7_HETSC